MMPKAHIGLLSLILSILLIFSACKDEPLDMTPQNGELKVGQYLEDFSLENEHTEQVSLSDFRGKTVLVEFWASWCSYCLEEIPELNSLYKDYHHQDFEIIGVSIDENRDQWISKLDEIKSQYTHVIEPYGFDAPLIQRYGIGSIPTMILIDGKGKVLAISTKTAEIRHTLESYLN